MRRSFKIRLRLTKKQARMLQEILDECRWLYNECLEQRILAYEELGETLSLYEQHAFLPLLKEERPSLDKAHSQVLQNVVKRLDLAFNAFFRRVKEGQTPGFPRFQGLHRYQSFCYPQSGFSIEDGHVKLSKIGKLRIVQHRTLEGTVKTCTISKNAVGEWYVSFSCEVDAKRLPSKKTRIDLGIENFATLTDHSIIKNPRTLMQSSKALARAQRKKELLPRGSIARQKQAQVVAKIHNKVKNRRENFCHQESRRISNQYQFIAIEDLSIPKMVEGSYMAKNILDASWNRFRQFLIYKAEDAGRHVTLVNPAYTSQDCSQCGHREKKDLKERQHRCSACGFQAHRDFNAALNILALGLDGQGETPRSPFL